MTAIHLRLPPLIEQLQSATGEDAQLLALNALRQALEPSNSDGGPCLDHFVATWLPGCLQQLQANISSEVRRSLAVFTGQLVLNHTGVQALSDCTSCLAVLLRDNVPGVVKEAVLAFACLLRASLALVSLKPSQPDVRDMWDNVRRLQAEVCLVSQEHPRTCVKVAAAKVAEHIVLLLTGDAAPSVPGVPETLVNKLRLPDAARLAAEADPLLRWLLEPLRPVVALEQPPARLIAHIAAAWSITVARPNLMGKLLPCLMALAKEGGFLATNSPSAAQCTGADLSVGNALRNGLAAVLKSRVPSSVPWRDRIVAALGALGAVDTAVNMMKYIERQEYKERRALRDKRPADAQLTGLDAKRVTGTVGTSVTAAPPPAVPAGAVVAPAAPAPAQWQPTPPVSEPAPAAPSAAAASTTATAGHFFITSHGGTPAPPGMSYAILQPGPNGVMTLTPYSGNLPPLPQQQPGGGPVQQYSIPIVQGPPPKQQQQLSGGPMDQQFPVQPQAPAPAPYQPQPQPQPQSQPQLQPQPQPQSQSQSQSQPQAVQAQNQAQPPPLQPHQLQHQAALQAAAIVTAAAQIAAGLLPVTAPPSDPTDVDQMLQYVDAAVRSKDEALLDALLTGLVHGQPALLADLVLMHMHLLPPALPQHLWPGTAPVQAAPPPATPAQAAPPPATSVQAAPPPAAPAPAAPAPPPYPPPAPATHLPQFLIQPPPPPPPSQPAPVPAISAPALSVPTRTPTPTPPAPLATAAAAPPPSGAAVAESGPQAPYSRRLRGPLPPLPGPARPKEMDPSHLLAAGKVAAAGAAVQAPLHLPPLRPAALSSAQAIVMRQNALKRLMAMPPGAGPGRQMRQAILARFGARVAPGDATSDQLLQHLLRHYHEGGFDLALAWLTALFVQACPLPSSRLKCRRQTHVSVATADEVADADTDMLSDDVKDLRKDEEDGKAVGEDAGFMKEVKERSATGEMDNGDVTMTDAFSGTITNGPSSSFSKQGTYSEDGSFHAGKEGGGQEPGHSHARDCKNGAAAEAGPSSNGQEGRDGSGDARDSAAAPDLSGTAYETVLLALLERAKQHAVTWHARQLRRYSRALRDTAAALQQQRTPLQPLQPTARVAAGLESLLATARQLQANVAWASAQGTWLQNEAAGMDLGAEEGGLGGGEGGGDGGEEGGAVVPELADEVAGEVEGVQASVQESMMQLRQWQMEAGQPLTAAQAPAQPPRPVVGFEVKELLKAAPSLPLAGVLGFLRDLLTAGGKWPALALSCAWDAIETRPPVRAPFLELVLEAAEDPHEEIRSAAVRLLTSKLYPRPHLRPTIVATAALRLTALRPPTAPSPTEPVEAGVQVSTSTTTAAPVAAPSTPPHSAEVSVADCSRRVALYMALVAKQPDLLPGLVVAYAAGGAHLRTAIGAHAGALALALGPSHSALLAQLRAPVPGSEDLLLVMLHALTEKDLPPGRLVDACKAWYAASGDPRVMVPVAFTLSRRDVISLLPVMLLSLQPSVLKRLYRSLVSKHGEVEPLFSTSELLLVLHRDLDPMRDGVPLKSLMSAVDLALHSPDIFPQPVMLAVIRSMESLVPLPRMFMRTVIQALKAAPRLRVDVAQLLERLVAKQIWTDRDQWRGFVLCTDHMRSDAYTPLLQLPDAILEVTLLGGAASEGARQQAGRMGLPHGCQLPLASGARLAVYVLQPAPNQPAIANVLITHQMRNILQRLLQIHSAQEAAAAVAAAARAVKADAGAGDAASLGPVKTEPGLAGAVGGLKTEPGLAGEPVGAIAPQLEHEAFSQMAVVAGGADAAGRGAAGAAAITIRAGREAAAAAAAAAVGDGPGMPAIKSERVGVSAAVTGTAALRSRLVGAADGVGKGLEKGDQQGLVLRSVPVGQDGAAAGVAGQGPGAETGVSKSTDDAMMEDGAVEERGMGGSGTGGVGAEMEVVESGAGGGTNEFELDFEDDL